MIKYDQFRGSHPGRGGKLFQFAAANQGCRVGTVATLQECTGNFRSRADCQFAQFVERFLRRKRHQVLAHVLPRL